MTSVEAIRDRFPALRRIHRGHPVAYFDGPGGTQVPRDVVEAMTTYLYEHNANSHWHYATSIETDEAIAGARQAFADFFNATPSEVAFGNNMTTIAFHVARALGRGWGPGDEIVVTELDHQGNVGPWQAIAKERGIMLRMVPFDPAKGALVEGALASVMTAKTRLVAIGAASNALGTVNDVREAARLAHARGALCFVDAVHYAAHRAIDVKVIDCDFLVCSPYKFYGPHTGVLYAKASVMAALDVAKLEPAPNQIPERMETGTQNHEGIVGAGAAVDFLASLAPAGSRRGRLTRALGELHQQGEALVAQLWEGLNAIPGVRCYGPPPGTPRTPTISFSVEDMASVKVAEALAEQGIFVSHGNFYATNVLARLGIGPEGLVRAGCACYTTPAEVQRLVSAIASLRCRVPAASASS